MSLNTVNVVWTVGDLIQTIVGDLYEPYYGSWFAICVIFNIEYGVKSVGPLL